MCTEGVATRIPVLISCPLAMLALAFALAPPAHATWSEQGVVIGTLEHYSSYYRATMLHDVSGAYFAYLPYSFADFLLHLDATQTSSWVYGSLSGLGHAPPASAWGNAVALDGSGGLFVLDGSTSPIRLHHVLPDGTQDWGDPNLGIAVDAPYIPGVDLVADGTGGAWGAWGATGGVRLQHWLSGGTVAPGWGPVGRLFPHGWFPALAGDGAGGVLLFFGNSSDMRAHVTRVQADTTIAPGWTEAGLDLGGFSANAIAGFHTLMLPSGDAGWIAVWQGESATLRSAFARRFLSDGTLDPAWAGGTALDMVTCTDEYSCRNGLPATFSDGAGGFHHVWADTATCAPRWLHVTASGGYATGFGWNGIPVLRAGDGIGTYGSFVPAPSDNGGIVLAWDDIGAGRAPAVRLRWLMPDGSDDPAAPDTGRVIPGTDADSHIWGLDAGPAGGVFTLWSNHWAPERVFLMNEMRRTPYVVDVPSSAGATTLALAPPRPTPTRGPLDVRCTLPSQAPATLSLFDVSGRRLQGVTLQGAGDHVARLDPPGDLAPGVYLLRLTQGRESRTARAVIIR